MVPIDARLAQLTEADWQGLAGGTLNNRCRLVHQSQLPDIRLLNRSLLACKLSTPPTPVHKLNNSIPMAVAGAIQRGLVADPDQRLRSCQELAQAIVAGLSGTTLKPVMPLHPPPAPLVSLADPKSEPKPVMPPSSSPVLESEPKKERYPCPNCGRTLKFRSATWGKMVRCPICQTLVQLLPAPKGRASPPSPSPAPPTSSQRLFPQILDVAASAGNRRSPYRSEAPYRAVCSWSSAGYYSWRRLACLPPAGIKRVLGRGVRLATPLAVWTTKLPLFRTTCA